MKLRVLVAAIAGALVLTTAAIAAPTSASPAPTPSPAARAVAAGSYLVVTESGPDADFGGVDPHSQSLVLVSSTGETRTIFTQKVKHFHTFILADWSADGATALLLSSNRRGGVLIKVDVETGATQSMDVPRLDNAILDPAGTGVLVNVWKGPHSNSLVLEAVTWTGVTTTLRTKVSGQMIAGHAGTVLTNDASNGRVQLLLSTTTGAVVSQFRTKGYCTAVRWWDATRTLQTCANKYNLYLIDPMTGSSTQLTNGHGNGDYGHMDARQVGSKLFVQVAGACGYTYVGQVTKHSTKHLKVPGAVGNVLMVDAVGNDLVLEHAASCDGDRPRSELTLFDPATHHETVLLRLGRHEDFGAVRALGDVRASTF